MLLLLRLNERCSHWFLSHFTKVLVHVIRLLLNVLLSKSLLFHHIWLKRRTGTEYALIISLVKIRLVQSSLILVVNGLVIPYLHFRCVIEFLRAELRA